jgi:hypothetical protein
LFNNNGANSTQKPTYTAFNTTSTEVDGYIWKYMYSLNTNDRRRFLTDEWMPVKRLTNDDASPQWGVQEAAIDGSINVILVTNPGLGYTNASNALVTVYGDGVGATATAYLNVSSGAVDNVIVTSTGRNYTFANISIEGCSVVGGGVNCYAIMGPINGHGSDPVNELGASTIIINTRINADEAGKLPVVNDFRQLALVRDPYIFGTETYYANAVFTQLTILSLAGSGPEYLKDEFVYQGISKYSATFGGRVFDWDTGNGKIKLTETFGTPLAKNLNGETSGAARFVTKITNPDIQARSGQVLYIDNVEPVSRSFDQTENLTVVIKF